MSNRALPDLIRQAARRFVCASVLVLSMLAFTLPCAADDSTSNAVDPRDRISMALNRFDQAVALRDHDSPAAQRLYAESLDRFESVIADGVENGHLHYNAGNAALRLGRIGEAIAHFKLANALIPGDKDVVRNLAFARRLCALQVTAKPTNAIMESLLFWHHGSSTRGRWFVMIGAYALFWALLGARLRLRQRSPAIFWSSAIVAMIAVATMTSVGFDAFGYNRNRQGVVIRNDTILRKGNGEGYQPQLENPLPDGVEFSILEIRDSADGNRWLRIELPDGIDGWINAERAIVI